MASVTHILAAGTTVEGQVRGDGDLTIAGVVRGGVELRGIVNIAEGGSVIGDVRCTHLTISGTVRGDVVVEGRTTIRQGATLQGSLATGRLDVQGGARIQASIETTTTADTPGLASASTPAPIPGPGSAGPSPSAAVAFADADDASAMPDFVTAADEQPVDISVSDALDTEQAPLASDDADTTEQGDDADTTELGDADVPSSAATDRLSNDPGVSDAEDASPPEPDSDDP